MPSREDGEKVQKSFKTSHRRQSMLVHPRSSPSRNYLNQLSVIMMPVMISMIMRSLLVTGQNCFGGIETFEKVSMTDFDDNFSPAGILLQQEDTALTRDCINLCKQQPSCLSFGLDYNKFRCAAYAINSSGRKSDLIATNSTNFFEKVCYRGVSRDEYEKICGIERLWSFERVIGGLLEGFDKVTLNNVASRSECAKACLMESSFACRSAVYDEVNRVCRLSKEDRRSQPGHFKIVHGSNLDYLENQCSAPGPSTCLYETKKDVGVITMDSLVFSATIEDCQFKCDKEHTFNCRSYSVVDKRCFLSGDDSVSLTSGSSTTTGSPLPVKYGSLYGEKKCVTERCLNGIFTYEKVVGYSLRTAITTSIKVRNTGSLGITDECRTACDDSGLTCPAFTINYSSSRCEKLDRNTAGHTLDLHPQDGESIFEKVCLRVPESTMSMCRDKFWAFERVIGHEMTPASYVKTYNFVQTRRDCLEYCLHEKDFACRSVLYNEESTDCKLSPDDRRTKPFNYVRNNNYKVSYLENQCIRDHSRCPFHEVPNAYPSYTDIVEHSLDTIEDCRRLCNDNQRFLCRSYAYYSSNNQCFLSGDDRASAGSTALTSRPGMSYYERKCDVLSSLGPSIAFNDSIGHDDPNDHSSHGHADHVSMVSHGLSGRDEGDQPVRVPTFTDDDLSVPTTTFQTPTSSSSTTTSTSERSPPRSFPASARDMGHGHPHPPMVPTSTPPSKCGANFYFTFERIPNFEPVGGYLNLLFADANNPGIVPECSHRCQGHRSCRAFIVDYNSGSCHGIFDNSSIGRFDLRLSIGKDYFEGFCIPNHLPCHKVWHFDRIVDQASVGVSPRQTFKFISRSDCKIKCLEEGQKCRSASFDGHLMECKLYDVDRHGASQGQTLPPGQSGLGLSFTKGIDYLENQCTFDTKSCSFGPYERDQSMVSVAKSLRTSSAFFCEEECRQEVDFNCRSFTFVYQTSIPDANICLLSSDSKKTSQKGSVTYRPRSLYGERECGLPVAAHVPGHGQPDMSMARDGRVVYHGDRMSPMNPYTPSLYPSTSGHSSMPMGSPYAPSSMAWRPSSMFGQSGYSTSGSSSSMGSMYNNILPPIPSSPSAAPLSPSNYPSLHGPISTVTSGVDYESDLTSPCKYDRYTFEKTFGYDMRYARKDRSRLPPRIGVLVQCQDECLRRGHKCNSFTIEYGSVQSCYFLEESASDNRKVLQKVPEVAYFEKVCLKESRSICGQKLWAFERVIGFDLDETPDKEVTNVDRRTDCQDVCLSEKSINCRSATYNYKTKTCRLFEATRRSRPQSFKPTLDDMDYFENHCSSQAPTCQYKDHSDLYFPFVDRLTNGFSLSDCQRQCDHERSFSCRAVSYEMFARECSLYSEDTASLRPVLLSHYSLLNDSDLTTTAPTADHVTSFSISSVLQPRRHTVYSEKGSCEQVTVDCTQQDMLLTMNFDSPFSGRVYAKGNPSQCYVLGTGSTQLQFAISLGSKCGTRPEGDRNFANEVVIQTHPVIMTDSDRTVRVLCSFEAIDQTVTLMSPNSGIDVHKKSYLYASDHNSASDNGTPRTRSDPPATSLVTNSAPPPSVIMRILDKSGRDAQVVGLGDELTLQIEMRDPSSVFGLFARNLYARSSGGESLFLLDNSGCPTDPVIFPALTLSSEGKALQATFKAFRFPSSGIVNFEVQVRICQDKCDPVKCSPSAHLPTGESYGRRRRSLSIRQMLNLTSDADEIDALESTLSEEKVAATTESSTTTIPTQTTNPPTTSSDLRSPLMEGGKEPRHLINESSSRTDYHQPLGYPPTDQMALSGGHYQSPYSYPNHNYMTSYQGPSDYHHPPNHPYPPSPGNHPNPFSHPYQSGPGSWTGHSWSSPAGLGGGFGNGHFMNQPRSPPTSSPTPDSETKKKPFRPPRPLQRPKGSSATTTGTQVTGSDTLRTTIMVGEDDKTNWTTGSGVKDKSSWTRGAVNGHCNSGPAVLYTAIIVTLLHVGIVLGGYFYYKKFGYSRSTKLFPSSSLQNIVHPNEQHTMGTTSGHQVSPSASPSSSFTGYDGRGKSIVKVSHLSSSSGHPHHHHLSSPSTNPNVFYGRASKLPPPPPPKGRLSTSYYSSSVYDATS